MPEARDHASSVSVASLRRALRLPPLGFTPELLIALTLLGLISALLSSSLSWHSWDHGEQKVEQVTRRRLTNAPADAGAASLRFQKVVDQPLYFGVADSLTLAVRPPGRAGAALYFASRFTGGSIATDAAASFEYVATASPDFHDAESSVLAEDITEVRFGYFGRDVNSNDANVPTWRDRWDDPQILPLLIRIDVKPAKSQAWPTMIVEPRLAPEAGCLAWDPNRNRCLAT